MQPLLVMYQTAQLIGPWVMCCYLKISNFLTCNISWQVSMVSKSLKITYLKINMSFKSPKGQWVNSWNALHLKILLVILIFAELKHIWYH